MRTYRRHHNQSSSLLKISTDTKQTRTIKKSVPTDSFFNFFSPPKPPKPTEGDEDGDGKDDASEPSSDIEERLEIDYGIGEDFKEKLIPRAVDWFTGEALQFEQLGDDADEEGMFEDEDDEDEDDLSDDKDEDEDSEEEVSASLIPSKDPEFITKRRLTLTRLGGWSKIQQAGYR